MKTIIERGASWTLEETKLLLALWGQDLVQRQATNIKRTKEVYEKISEKFLYQGFERTADQVRTRVFNMIAEYRRILKDPNPERMKKCIFFEALHKIYQAKHMDDVKSALDDYEPEYPYSPASNTISSEKGDESISDGEATDGNETINNNATNIETSSNNNNNTINNNNNSVNDNNNGDSSNNTNNNNNNAAGTEKESSSANSHAAGASSLHKRMKLESSPKSGQNQTNQVNNNNSMNTASTSTVNSTLFVTSADPTSNSKQTSKTQIPLVATTLGGASIASTSNSSSSSSSSSQRHQSLLMPHATTSSASSTPMSKLTTACGNTTPSYININSTKLPIIRTNQLIGHPNGNEPINLNGTANRLPTTAAITSHQLYQAPVNTFDVTSSALLIDRMFAHLSRESENMREWIALEKERIALERSRRQQETEREVRRERVLIDTLMRFQEQWLSFLTRLDPRIVENSNETPPELKIPSKEASSAETSQCTQASNITTTSTATTSNSITNNSNSSPSDASKQ